MSVLSLAWLRSTGSTLVIVDHSRVSHFENNLILTADEFLDPGIILAEVPDVALRQKFPVCGKDGHRGLALKYSVSRSFHFQDVSELFYRQGHVILGHAGLGLRSLE
jgi:hypothetical protein